MEGVFVYCVCQSECRYCGMCSHSWSIDSTAFLVTSVCQETRLLPSFGCSTTAICGQKKKIASQLRISLICLRCCQLWFAEYDKVNWHYQLLSETCRVMWGNETYYFSGGERLWKQKALGLGSVQLCGCGILRVKSVRHRKCGWHGSVGEWLHRDEEHLGDVGAPVLGAVTAPEHPSSLPLICWGLGNLFWPLYLKDGFPKKDSKTFLELEYFLLPLIKFWSKVLTCRCVRQLF